MIKIVKANLDHSALLAELNTKSFWESHGKSASKEDIDTFVSTTYSKDAYAQELSNPENIYHLLYLQDQLAGYSKIVCNTANLNIKHENITKLDRFYFLKQFYGQNLGTELLKHNIQLSKKKQQRGMWLAVWTENHRAVNFYNKAGFETAGSYDFKISETHSNPNHILYLSY